MDRLLYLMIKNQTKRRGIDFISCSQYRIIPVFTITQPGNRMSNATEWLLKLVGERSDGKVEFRPSAVGGLGGFAVVDLVPGDLVFSVPSELILTSESTRVLEHPAVRPLKKDLDITLESGLFVYMAQQLKLGKDEYIRSLPTKSAPLVASELSGTNVGAQVQKDYAELESQLAKIHALCGQKTLTLAEFAHAKFNYNSRRFPLAFGGSGKETGGTLQRRKYDPTQGSLCPLLDVLNSKASDNGTHRLSFVTSGQSLLKVITNVAVAQGEEVFNDYGCVSNNQSLLQFHFCDKSLPATFTVIVGGNSFDLNASEMLPEELTIDGGYGLHSHLSAKLNQMNSAVPSSNEEVKWYMDSQRTLLNTLLRKCEVLIGLEENGECSDVEGVDESTLPDLKKRKLN